MSSSSATIVLSLKCQGVNSFTSEIGISLLQTLESFCENDGNNVFCSLFIGSGR